MKGIYKFECDYGRSGTLSGIFIATEEQIAEIHSKTIHLGECLGKHSEVYFESLNEYAKDYCITNEVIGNRDIILLHPGPVNRNVDISDEMLKDPRSKVLQQVTNGVAIRAAVLKKLILK